MFNQICGTRARNPKVFQQFVPSEYQKPQQNQWLSHGVHQIKEALLSLKRHTQKNSKINKYS